MFDINIISHVVVMFVLMWRRTRS